MSRIVEHIKISEHLTKIAEKLIGEHLFYTISIATNKITLSTFFPLHKWIVKRVWLLGTPEYKIIPDMDDALDTE